MFTVRKRDPRYKAYIARQAQPPRASFSLQAGLGIRDPEEDCVEIYLRCTGLAESCRDK